MSDAIQFAGEVLLGCSGLGKRFHEGRLDVTVLRGVDLQVHRGSGFVALQRCFDGGKQIFAADQKLDWLV